MNTLKHLRCNKTMSFNQKFMTKWNEQHRKEIGYYEPIPSLKSLFGEGNKLIAKKEIQFATDFELKMSELLDKSPCRQCDYLINGMCTYGGSYKYCTDFQDFKEQQRKLIEVN